MRAKEFINEISRRGFLKGAGAAAATGAALSPFIFNKPEVTEPEVTKDEPVVKKHVPVLSSNPALEKILHQVAATAKPPIEGIELAQFLAQCYHESTGFSRMKEKGGPKYFKKLYDIAHNPRLAKILGNLHIGDGIRYHGRGFIQLTGRENYRKAGIAIGQPLEDNPELASNPTIAAEIAVWYWTKRVRPYVSDFSDTSAITRKINSKLEGLESRESVFNQYIKSMH